MLTVGGFLALPFANGECRPRPGPLKECLRTDPPELLEFCVLRLSFF